MSFRDFPFLKEISGGSLKISRRKGRFCIKYHVSCDRKLISCDRKLVSCDRKKKIDVSLNMSHRKDHSLKL